MKPPFQVIVVLGDGSRVVRFSLPRWIAYATIGLFAAAAISVVGLSGQHLLLERQWVQLVSLRRRVEDQKKLIDSFQTRIASVRTEIMNWKASHAKMWEAFGPDKGSQQKTGVGGASPDIYSTTAGVKPPAEELEMLASTVAEEGPRLRELEHVVSRTGKMMSTLPLRWPLRGHVRSEFGLRQSPWTGAAERHDGLDIGSPPGTPVKAPAPGKVIIASQVGDYGKHVMIDHGNGVRSLYGHMRKLEVKAGQKVEKGQVIGQVGSTGRSTGPHLHYELLVQGKPVNPRGFLWER
jgi:murein DD-endopeptidase MepM/ murein hydrolase activator NlpD